MAYIAPHSPVADWRAVPQGHGYGNYFDPVTGTWATVTRTTPKTARIAADKLVDVPAGKLALEPWSLSQTGGVGLAAIIEEARTNAYLDSYFAAADITAAWASDGTLTRSTDVPAVYGTHVAKVVLTGGAGDSNATKVLLSQERPYSAAQTVTTSAWARGSATGLTVQRFIEAIDVSNAVLGTVTANITLGAWERSTLTYANLPAGTVKTRSGIRAIAVDTGDTVTLYVDAAQSEAGAFATSYIPTTTAAATRNGDGVTVPPSVLNAAAGTLVAVVGASAQGAYVCRGSGGYGPTIYRVNSALMAFSTVNPTKYDTVSATNVASHVYAGRWENGQPNRILADGVAGARSDVYSTSPDAVTSLTVGSYSGGSFGVGALSRFIIYATALSDAQLQAADMTTDLLAGLDTARITNEVTL